MPDLPAHLLTGAHAPSSWAAVGVARHELRQALGRREYRGRHAWAATDPAHPRQRALAAASLLPDDVGAVGGWAAAFLLGATTLDGTTPAGEPVNPLLCLPGSRRVRRAGVRVLRSELFDRDVVQLTGASEARVTSPVRTVFDLARTAESLADAVTFVDAMARNGVRPSDVEAYAVEHRGWKGVPQVRRAAELASSRTRSPAETRLRMLWQLDAGLPPPLVNATVLDRHGQSRGEVDLLDAGLGLVGEYDGSPHSDAGARSVDAVKQEALERVGLVVVRATAVDMRPRHRRRTVWRLREAAKRARGLPPGDWTAVERPIPPLPLASYTEWSAPSQHAGES